MVVHHAGRRCAAGQQAHDVFVGNLGRVLPDLLRLVDGAGGAERVVAAGIVCVQASQARQDSAWLSRIGLAKSGQLANQQRGKRNWCALPADSVTQSAKDREAYRIHTKAVR